MSAALSFLADRALAPASHPRGDVRGEKLLVIDTKSNRLSDSRIGDLAQFVSAGDLVVMNDAATFPASLRGHTRTGEPIEARLTEPPLEGYARAILFGAGDWHSKTEDRKLPPRLNPGEAIRFDDLHATVVRVDARSPRLVELFFAERGDDLWNGLYSAGKPIQYSYLDRELALWDVQTPFASRPLAVEMPSAGRPLAWSVLFELQKKGARIARLSHAAGLSSSGDPDLDARLPFSERYEIPRETISDIAQTKQNGKRVVAVGTTVVRALEGCASSHDGALVSGPGETDLRLSGRFTPRIVDAVLSGTHEPGSSHFELLEAFASRELLLRAAEHAHARGYLTHEFGDACLIQ